MPCRRYTFAGLTVESSIALPGALPAAADRPITCWFTLADAREAPPPAPVATNSPARGLAVAATDTGFVLAFPGSAVFSVDQQGRRIRCWPATGLRPVLTPHLLLDQVLPRVLSLRGTLVLHASVVAGPGGAVGFLGPSGAGKSTLAAALVRAGWWLLADDVLAVQEDADGARALPTYPCLRLWPDVAGQLGPAADDRSAGQAADKRRIAVARFASRTTPLRRLYLLEHAPPPGAPATAPVRIQPLPTPQALVAAFAQEFRLARVDVPSLQPSLDRLANSSALRGCRRISYLRELGALPAVVEAIRRDLQASAPPPPPARLRGVW